MKSNVEVQRAEELQIGGSEVYLGRPFFRGLINYIYSSQVVPMVWEGLNVVKTGRQMPPIQLTLCLSPLNIIHGSQAVEFANKEIALWFTEKETKFCVYK